MYSLKVAKGCVQQRKLKPKDSQQNGKRNGEKKKAKIQK
jgi:hypothetical protein